MTVDPLRALPTRPRRARRWAFLALALVILYLLAAYWLIPLAWESYGRRHPTFDDNPRLTQTSDGHPGDPLNVALIASEQQLQYAMRAAKWFPAAPLGLKSDLKIAADTVLSRSDVEAPVSRLYLFGRQEDLAFEQPVGNNPRQRHHVRLWRTTSLDSDGRPTWIGSASYDERVGFSHTTGQVTHHIAPDVDTERDHLFDSLENSGSLSDVYAVDDFHTVQQGRNGGGDRWHTDGRLLVGVVDVH
jgi:hypothetical protein